MAAIDSAGTSQVIARRPRQRLDHLPMAEAASITTSALSSAVFRAAMLTGVLGTPNQGCRKLYVLLSSTTTDHAPIQHKSLLAHPGPMILLCQGTARLVHGTHTVVWAGELQADLNGTGHPIANRYNHTIYLEGACRPWSSLDWISPTGSGSR